MNLHLVQFQYGFEWRGLTYPQLVQTFQDIIGWNLWHRCQNFISSCIELLHIIITKSDREQISVIQYCIMNASDSKVVKDHEGDVSPSQKPILFLSCLFLQADLLFWSGNSGWSCSKQMQFSCPAFQNSGSPYPQLIAKVSIHPMNPTISTSLIHNIASDGKSEQIVTRLLNLVFQNKNVENAGNLSKCSSEICCLCCPTIEFCGISTRNNEFMVDGLLANVGVGIVPYLDLHLFWQESLSHYALELILYHLVSDVVPSLQTE